MKTRSIARVVLALSLFVASSPLAGAVADEQAPGDAGVVVYRADSPTAAPAARTIIGNVRDYICRKPWEADATDDEAVALLKAKARGIGANGLIDVRFDRHRADVKAACWQRVSASATAVVFANR